MNELPPKEATHMSRDIKYIGMVMEAMSCGCLATEVLVAACLHDYVASLYLFGLRRMLVLKILAPSARADLACYDFTPVLFDLLEVRAACTMVFASGDCALLVVAVCAVPLAGDDAVTVGYVDCSSDDKHMLHPGIFLILAFPSQWKL